MKNLDATSGEGGVVLEIRTHPDKGRGWFENPRFWRTSFVDGPLDVLYCYDVCTPVLDQIFMKLVAVKIIIFDYVIGNKIFNI